MSDFAAKLAQARQQLPLKRLMEQYGRGPSNGNWKTFPKCPYCGKDSAGVFAGAHGDLFKCHHSSCPSGTQHDKAAWDEIAFLAYELKLNRKEASLVWLKQAGILKEPGKKNLPRTGPSLSQLGTEPSHDQVVERPENNHPGPATAESWCSNGAAAVPPTSSLFADGVNASPAGFQPPTPEPSGEASFSPADARVEESGEDANGAPPAPPTGDNGEPPRLGPTEALREFFEQITLTQSDLEKLWKLRCLTEEACVALGFRSSQKSNKEILLRLKDKYPENVLVESCLWVRDDEPGAKARPNSQYYGWGVKGKDAEGNDVFDWTYPILIPYLDHHGELLDLRPHKRTQKGQSPRLYIPRVLKEHRKSFGQRLNHPQFAVITEGEFKAAALFQAVGDIAAVGALPGITMAKPLFGDIEDWLGEFDLRQVVVAYDNEDKGDKNLPGYIEEIWWRFESEIWARYLVLEIAREGYQAKIGHLRNAWRQRGKADWDSAMALLRDQVSVKGTRSIEVWKNVSGKVRAEFLNVFKEALPPEELSHSGLYTREAENIIAKKVRGLQSRNALPDGGYEEEMIARRLRRLYARIKNDRDRIPPKMNGYLLHLAKLYDDLKGGYYILKKQPDGANDRWTEILEKAAAREDVEVKRACEIVLQGKPKRITDFIIQPLYVLRKPNGKRERVLRIQSMHGPCSDLLSLPSGAYAQPSKLREWIFDNFDGATWFAGERELNALQFDLTRETIYKPVTEVALRGLDDEGPGLRFFADCAYSPEGAEIFPDRNGIIWYKGKGYRPADKDCEGQKFVQSLPSMRPHSKVTDEQTRELFIESSRKLFEAVGNYGGYLALGAALLYGAGQEFYEEYTGFPGLWLHGASQQGKSSVARWLLRIWGFKNKAGIPLPDSTKAGLGIALQQYGDLPVWLEEYQPALIGKFPWLIEKLKEIYGRESGVKKTFDEVPRRIRTGVIVTGVGTSPDAQLRSRFCHVQVAKANRLKYPNHYHWFERESLSRFYLIGRWLMRNRKEFAATVMKETRLWVESDAMAEHPERARIVHGAPFCAFRALVAMLQSHDADDMRGFRDYLLNHVEQSVEEVQEQAYVQQFWTDVLAANKEGVFGHSPSERGEIFKAVADSTCHASISPQQTKTGEEDPWRAWSSVKLFFTIDSLIARLKKWLKQQGRDLALDKNDLRAQMKVQGYWLEGEHRQRFNGAKSGQRCWGISADKHPLGYLVVSDESFIASFVKGDGHFFASEDWVDPRKGDLFALIDSLKPQKEKE